MTKSTIKPYVIVFIITMIIIINNNHAAVVVNHKDNFMQICFNCDLNRFLA